jgi:hypothetical protein
MTRRFFAAALLAASCAAPALAAQEKAREERGPAEQACRAAAQRHRTAEETLRRAKEEEASAKIVERRTAEVARARRDYCNCLSRAGQKSGQAPVQGDEEICESRPAAPAAAGNEAPTSPTPTPAGANAACADAAASYEKTWMRYSEDTKSQTLHRQVQSSKTRLCECLTKNYGYEGVLPRPLRDFCEDREILTPPYFPSRGEKPPTAAP